jgi:hypothetical protein
LNGAWLFDPVAYPPALTKSTCVRGVGYSAIVRIYAPCSITNRASLAGAKNGLPSNQLATIVGSGAGYRKTISGAQIIGIE